MQKTIESDIRNDRVINHDEEVAVINEVPVEVVPVHVSDSVIVDGVVDPNGVVVKVDTVPVRSSIKRKYSPVAGLLLIGILSTSGSTATAITIEAGIADQNAIGKTILANDINHIHIAEANISDISRTDIRPIIEANIHDSRIQGIAEIAK